MQGAMGGSGETVLIMAAVIPTRNDGACTRELAVMVLGEL